MPSEQETRAAWLDELARRFKGQPPIPPCEMQQMIHFLATVVQDQQSRIEAIEKRLRQFQEG